MANRVSQHVVEVLDSSSATTARISQQAVEVIDNNSNAQAIVSQFVVEVLRENNTGPILDPHTHLSQVAVEVLRTHQERRVSQLAVESLHNSSATSALVSQQAVEVLFSPAVATVENVQIVWVW